MVMVDSKHWAAALLIVLSASASAQNTGPSRAEGRQIAEQVCAACHGVDGNSPDPARPSLAQQGAAYLYSQLQQFKAQGGQRANGVMGAIAVNLSDDEMRIVSAYFARQTLIPPRQAYAPLAARGEAIYLGGLADKNVPACASCHGTRAEGLAPLFPRLAGQHAPYIARQLMNFRSGSRAGDFENMMHGVSVRLTNREMNAVAQYVAQLR